MFEGKFLSLKKDENQIYFLHLHHEENTFNSRMIIELKKCVHILKNTPGRGLITTGSSKFFSNGVDLKNTKNVELFLIELESTVIDFIKLPFPTIAAINGHAFGGGLLFALAHDFRFMREDRGWVCIPAVKLDIDLPSSFIDIISLKVGTVNAKEILLLGKKYISKEAKNLNIIDDYFSNEDLIKKSKEFLMNISQKSAYYKSRNKLYSKLYFF
eukprot:gene8844-794_t